MSFVGTLDTSDFVDAEISICAVCNHVLAGHGLEVLAVDGDRQLLGVERDQVSDALHLC